MQFCAMAQADCHRPFTTEALLHSEVNTRGICGGRSGTRTFLLQYFSFPLSVSLRHGSVLIRPSTADSV